jgi:hypothetical protein
MCPEIREIVASIVGFAIHDPLATSAKGTVCPYFGYRAKTLVRARSSLRRDDARTRSEDVEKVQQDDDRDRDAEDP